MVSTADREGCCLAQMKDSESTFSTLPSMLPSTHQQMQCRDCSAQTLWWLQTEIEAIRDDIAPTWLQHPLSLQQTADKFVRSSLQQVGDVNQQQTVCVATYAHAFVACVD